MGNTCEPDQLPKQRLSSSIINIEVINRTQQTHKQQLLIKKYSSIRTEANSFPNINNHVEQTIKKLMKFKPESTKIWKLKSPYNLVYMNQLRQDQNQLPKGYVKIYKLKQSGEFVGYYQGKVGEKFTPDLTHGFFVFKNASYFEGTGVDRGIYTNLVTKLRYQGGWLNQQPHGKGQEHNSEGFYQGEYFQGQKQGKGKFVLKDQSQYIGTFMKGNLHGKGVFSNPILKYSYEGEYFDGLRHGQGFEQKANQIYSGCFYKNKRCGKGKLQIFNDQRKQELKYRYEGMFENNKPHGIGTYVSNRPKRQIDGVWQNGKLKAICQ